MSKRLKENVIVVLKGMAIGVAELVPGLTGASIALISGIYDKMIDSIKSLNIQSLKVLFKKGPKEFWAAINGSFMLSLSLGILFSLLAFAKIIIYLTEKFPIFCYSFFFGIIVASIIYMLRDFEKWNFKIVFSLLVGIVIIFITSNLNPLSMAKEADLLIIIATAVFAAMIAYFPGISVSLILIMIGQYEIVLKSVYMFKLDFILVYFAASIIAFFTFAKFFSWLIKKFKNQSFAFLTGLLIGSLFQLWPWKHTLLSHTNRMAQIIPVKQENVFPDTYFELTTKDPQTLYAILMAITGFLLIYLLHHSFSNVKQE
jgi:putative membrane protein